MFGDKVVKIVDENCFIYNCTTIVQFSKQLGPVPPAAADLGLSGQDAFGGRTFGRFPASLFLPLALSSNWILILIQLLQVKDRQNVTHKQTDTVSEVAHFS